MERLGEDVLGELKVDLLLEGVLVEGDVVLDLVGELYEFPLLPEL